MADLNNSSRTPNPSSLNKSHLTQSEHKQSSQDRRQNDEQKGYAHVYQFQINQSYKNNHKPNINVEKQKQIQERLRWEKVAQQKAVKRIKEGDYFMKNPDRFFQENQLKHQKSIPSLFLQDKFSIKKNPPLSSPVFHRQKQEETKDSVQNGNSLKELSLQDIISINDKNFYTENIKDKNLFQIIKQNYRPLGKQDLIIKYHFALSSPLYESKSTIPAQHYISSKIRSLSLGKVTLSSQDVNQVLKAKDLHINLDNIGFLDIMNVSCGKISSKLMNSIIDNEKLDQDGQSEGSSQQYDLDNDIPYKKTTANNQSNCQNDNMDRQEITKYLQNSLSKQQIQDKRQYNMIIDGIRSNLEKKQRLVGETIKDRMLHSNITKNIDESLQYMQSMKTKQKDQVQKMIRQNKESKDRSERIKSQKLIEGLVLIKQSKERLKYQ